LGLKSRIRVGLFPATYIKKLLRANPCLAAVNELEWICPASKQLQRCLNLIGNSLLDPLDLNGKKALQMVSKLTMRKKRRRDPDGYGSLQDDDDPDGLGIERGKDRRAKKQKKSRICCLLNLSKIQMLPRLL
jgi:hypothetical protein